MVLANLSSGETRSFDLTKPDDCIDLDEMAVRGLVTGLSLSYGGMQHALPMPKRFRSRVFGAELSEHVETIYCQADDVRISLSRSLVSPFVRCDLVRTGKQQFRAPRLDKRKRGDVGWGQR